jgi:hypothetical protein
LVIWLSEKQRCAILATSPSEKPFGLTGLPTSVARIGHDGADTTITTSAIVKNDHNCGYNNLIRERSRE